MEAEAPLAGVRVVEVASYVAVPAAGALLADMGADVVKVEVPGGEIYRHGRPSLSGYATEFPENPASTRLFSSKIAMPGSDWSIGEVRRSRVWMLGLDARVAVASRDQERALVYTWRLRDQGILRETSRSLLALDSGPFRRERQRAVIRLSTPLAHDGPVARDRAKQTLDRFITDFRGELAEL